MTGARQNQSHETGRMKTVAANAECVLAADNHLGETPLWSVDERALYFINCENPPQVHRFVPDTGAHDTWAMPQRVGGIALRAGGKLLVVLADGLYDFDPATQELALRCASPLPPHVSLHECACDRQGRLWIGAYDHNFTPTERDARDGAYFRLDGDRLTRVIDGTSVANALAVSADGRTLYCADAPTRCVWQLALDTATGAASQRRDFLHLPAGEGFVDGACVDTQGGYWLAAVGAGALRRYLPDGTLERIVPLPVCNPTNATFGGPQLDMLYITTTQLALGADPAANGGIYALRPGFTGLPEPVLAE